MNRISIRLRIAIAFTLISIFVGGMFSLGIHQFFHAMEDELMSTEMDGKLQLIVQHDIFDPATLGQLGMQLYGTQPGLSPTPANFNKASIGFTEIEGKPHSYFVYRQVINGHDYVLVQDQSRFEDGFENNLFKAVKSGFLLTILLGGIVGWFLGKQIIAPILRLSKVITARNANTLDESRIRDEFSSDEVGKLALAFEETYSAAKDALWRERLFTSDVSHEFRSSLMVIATSCELLLQGKQAGDPDYDRLTRIARATSEMQQLIQAFLVIARAERTAENPNAKQTISSIADEAMQRWRLEFERKGIALHLLQREADSALTLNADLLTTVLNNLLKNALNYTEQGRVDLIIAASSVSVADTGMGINLAAQANIMQPFVRGSDLPMDGLGLGLSLVQRICDHQGWKLHLHSATGLGSTFTISLA